MPEVGSAGAACGVSATGMGLGCIQEGRMEVKLNWANAVVLLASDLERSRTFYSDSLGMDVTAAVEDAVVFRTESGGMLILIGPRRATALLGSDNVEYGSAKTGFYSVAEVEDVDEACVALRSRGVQFFREPESHPWGIRTAFFRDPDGHTWEISSDLPDE
jgi:catechol 2,3-dioxygenase-like lactoylglutathione lyase family enzyme